MTWQDWLTIAAWCGIGWTLYCDFRVQPAGERRQEPETQTDGRAANEETESL